MQRQKGRRLQAYRRPQNHVHLHSRASNESLRAHNCYPDFAKVSSIQMVQPYLVRCLGTDGLLRPLTSQSH